MRFRRLLNLFLTATAVCQTLPVAASELILTPGLRLAEEYNDNIFTTRVNKETDWITHINPSITMQYFASRLNWYLQYAPEYLAFASNGTEDRLNPYLSTWAKLTLLEKRLFLEVRENYDIISTNVARDITYNSGYNDQTSHNRFSISPYAEFHPDSQTLLSTGFSHINSNYGGTGEDSTENGVFLSVNREISRRTFLVADARYSYVTPDNNEDFGRSTLSVGVRREYAERSYVNLVGGYTLLNFKNGPDTSSPFWNVGLEHDFGSTTATFSSGVAYGVDSNQASSENRNAEARLENKTGRGVATIFASYDEYINNLTGETYSRRFGGGGSYLFNFTPQLSGTVGMTADKYSKGGEYLGLPYHTSEHIGIKYVFPHDLTASLTYSHFTWSTDLWSGSDNIETNRVMLEVVMTLPQLHKTF